MSDQQSFLVRDDETLRRILEATRTIAVVGLSPRPVRASNRVALYLQQSGYRIIPIHPSCDAVHGERAYKTLLEVPREIKIDLVDIFRRPEQVGPHVDEVIQRGDAQVLWLQDEVIDPAAAERAHRAGLQVVMDDCTMRRHAQLIGRR